MPDTLFPKLDEVQKTPRVIRVGPCTGGNGYDYICPECCNKFGLSFRSSVVNEVGRKACAFCGSHNSNMHSVTNKAREAGGCIIYY